MTEFDTDYKFSELPFDPYSTLNLPKDCTTDDVQQRYKQLSRTFHPDRQQNNNKDASSDEFLKINRAKEILVDPHLRKAFDTYGQSGVDMLLRPELYAEMRSWKVGKKYRNDDAVNDLLKYYLSRETWLALDRLVSSYGHIEIECDASLMFDEVVDTMFRHQSVPTFFHNIWHGIPILKLVLQEDGTIEGLSNDSTHVIMEDSDEFDDEYSLPSLNTMDFTDIFDTDEHGDNDDESMDMSSSELMSESVEKHIAVLQSALESGDVSTLKHIPIERQTVRPKVGSFLITLAHQYEWDQRNTFVMSSTQYLNMKASDTGQLFNQIDCELHHQFNQTTKLVSGISVGIANVGSRFTVSRAIGNKTSIDIGFRLNFLDGFWKSVFGSLYPNDASESAADVVDHLNSHSKTAHTTLSLWRVIPELLITAKDACLALSHFGGAYFTTLKSYSGHLYPGFDLTMNIKHLLFGHWMGVTSLRLGSSPSVGIGLTSHENRRKKWSFDFSLGKRTASLDAKHVHKLSKRMRWYLSTSLDFTHLFKIEWGISRTMIDDNLEEAMEGLSGDGSNIDMRGSAGVSYSVTQGLSLQLRVARGPSQCNVPIKLAESPTWKHVVTALTIPVVMYAGYKYWYRPRALKAHNYKVMSQLNNRGRSLFNQRQMAIQQQSIMDSDALKNASLECRRNGLVILAAFYGKNIETRFAEALRTKLGLDSSDDDDDDDNDGNGNTVPPNTQQSSYAYHQTNMNRQQSQQLSDADEIEEKRSVETINPSANSGSTDIGTFLNFDINADNDDGNGNNDDAANALRNEYCIYLDRIDWKSSNDVTLKDACDDDTEDMHLPSWISVKTALQYIVSKSMNGDTEMGECVLPSGSKTHLPGFYDCAPDDFHKQLLIVYSYENVIRWCITYDMLPLQLPDRSHLRWIDLSP